MSYTERKILLQVERLLISEVAVARQISEQEAQKLITPPKPKIKNGTRSKKVAN